MAAFFINHDLPYDKYPHLAPPVLNDLDPNSKWLFDRIKSRGVFICKTCNIVLRDNVNKKPNYLECCDMETCGDDEGATFKLNNIFRNHYGGVNATMIDVENVALTQNLPTLCKAAKLPDSSLGLAKELLLSTWRNKILPCDDYNEVEIAILHILSENSFELQQAIRLTKEERLDAFDKLIMDAITIHRNIANALPEDFHNHRYYDIKEDLVFLCKKNLDPSVIERFWLRADIILDKVCSQFVLPLRSDISIALGIYCLVCELECLSCPSLVILENNYEIKAQVIKSCVEIMKDQIL